jgi:hypothetical protein
MIKRLYFNNVLYSLFSRYILHNSYDVTSLFARTIKLGRGGRWARERVVHIPPYIFMAWYLVKHRTRLHGVVLR